MCAKLGFAENSDEVTNVIQYDNKTTKEFWKSYEKLPKSIQESADKQFKLFKQDPTNPGINFEKLTGYDNLYSARVTKQYRAYGTMDGSTITWQFINPHDYKALKRKF